MVYAGRVAADGFPGLVGLTSRGTQDGRSRVVLEAGDAHLNPAGFVHGGVLATLVDAAMGEALNTLTERAERPVTIEMKVNFLEPGRPGGLTATARVLKRGRRFTVVHAEVTQDDDGEAVAEAIGTYTTTG